MEYSAWVLVTRFIQPCSAEWFKIVGLGGLPVTTYASAVGVHSSIRLRALKPPIKSLHHGQCPLHGARSLRRCCRCFRLFALVAPVVCAPDVRLPVAHQRRRTAAAARSAHDRRHGRAQEHPNYANLRERYLREAAQCAAIKGTDDPFVSRKLFADGTKRMTISTNAGRDLRGSAMETDAACPGFRALSEQFSQTVEHAVNSFGAALDHTAFKASDGHTTISSRQLVSEAVRLDHFHAYEAAAPTTSGAAHRQLEELSLPLHEDHGLFIAMAAPKFFEVEADGRSLVERELAADASGLIIQTPSGQRVRPVLNGEELVLMMGTGASRWLQTSHKLPAVVHGMKMPEPLYGRSLRAWFGKMTLLPAYQRMLETNTPFEAHANATTRQLLTNDASQLKSVGCASDRQLLPSDPQCTIRQCSLKPGVTPPAELCAVICTRLGHSPNDATECVAKCTCGDVPVPGNVCWMLCVATLPENQCALEHQECSGQELTCTAPIAAPPAPATTAPPPTATTLSTPVTTAPPTPTILTKVPLTTPEPAATSPPKTSPPTPTPTLGRPQC